MNKAIVFSGCIESSKEFTAVQSALSPFAPRSPTHFDSVVFFSLTHLRHTYSFREWGKRRLLQQLFWLVLQHRAAQRRHTYSLEP